MIRRFTFVLFLLLPLVVFSQQKPTFRKNFYVDNDGKLFVNKNLPLYLWLSSSPDESSEKYRLTSQDTYQYSNPMYFDTDGYNSFRSPSAVDTVTRKTVYPLRDIVFEVYADGESPATTLTYGDSKPFTSNGKTYVKTNTNIVLKASDKLSGVESVYYSLDGAAYIKHTSPITFNEEREYHLKYFSCDNVGNDEEVSEITFVYDNTPPTTSLEIPVDEHKNIVSSRSKIELKAEDKGIGLKEIRYSIDSGNEHTYTYALNASSITQGEHTINYYSLDKVGNQEPMQSYTFYVDKSAPTIIEEIIAKTFFANGKEYASGKAQLKLTAFDNKAGIKEIRYSINGGEYLVYDKPVFLSSASGDLVIKTYAVDNVNNTSQSQTASSKTDIPFIDLTGPTLHHSFTGPQFSARDTIFVNSKTKIALKGIDQDAGVNRIEYRIDGKENLTYSGPFILSDEGIHEISYVGFDNVENTSTSTFTVKVDNTGPSVDYQFSTSNLKSSGTPEYPKYVILFLTGTDKVVGLEKIKYGFGQEVTSTYAAPIQGFASGDKSVIIEATDKLGNKTVKNLEFTIDTN